MTDARSASARAEATAADHFRRAGEIEAKVEAHQDRLEAIERRQQTYETRQSQLQVDIASIARLTASNAEAITRMERIQEEQGKELRSALKWALAVVTLATLATMILDRLS